MTHRIGPHIVLEGDIQSSTVDSMMQEGEKAAILYVDPPWGEGSMKFWTTLNQKTTGIQYEPMSFAGLLARINQLATQYVDGYVFIETGTRFEGAVWESMSHLHNVHTIHAHYQNGQIPQVILTGTTRPGLPRPTKPDGATDLELVTGLIGSVARPGKIVFDPCCGMGWTAQAALSAGMIFRGNEFNRARLAKTLARLK